MSKHPSPRGDQLRAMREAKFARNEQHRREEEKSMASAKRADAAPTERTPEAPATQATAKSKPKAAAKPVKKLPKKKAKTKTA